MWLIRAIYRGTTFSVQLENEPYESLFSGVGNLFPYYSM
jgi:hypothetical protein